MTTGDNPDGLKLTQDEAFALLGLCLTSPQGIDGLSERALRKLAEFCARSNHNEHNLELRKSSALKRGIGRAGA